MTTAQAFGKLLRRSRKAHNLTQDDVARLADVRRALVSEMERGEGNFTLESLEKVGAVLGVVLEPRFRRLPSDSQE